MKRVYIRHVAVLVALGAGLVPHWLPGRPPASLGPLQYVAASLLAVVLLVGWAIAKNRADAHDTDASA